jgi:hypothetical protein
MVYATAKLPLSQRRYAVTETAFWQIREGCDV